jgi:hypothetical protein
MIVIYVKINLCKLRCIRDYTVLTNIIFISLIIIYVCTHMAYVSHQKNNEKQIKKTNQ